MASRDYAEAIIRTVRDPLVILESDLRVHSANDAFYTTFKVSPAESEGRLIFDLGNGQWDIPALRTLLEEILQRNSFFNDFEVAHDFKGLGHRTMLLNARTLRDEKGQKILLGIHDISEVLRLEARVQHSELRYRCLFEAARDGVLIIDPATRKIIDANPFMTELLGYSHDELCGKELFEIGLLKDQSASQNAFRQLQDSGYIRYEDLPLETRDGQHREVEFVSNLYYEDGTALIQCNVRDITRRKQTERIAAQRERLLDLSSEAIIIRDIDDKVTYWNQGAEKLYGWSRDEALGSSLHSLLRTEFPKPYDEIVAGLKRDGVFAGEVAQVARDGRRLIASCHWVLERENEQGVRPILTTFVDITERKRAEEELAQARVELERHARDLETIVAERTDTLREMVRELESFSYSVSHDMRAPLRSILSFGQLIRNECAERLGDQHRDYLDRMIASANRLDRLVQDILIYSRTRRIDLRLESIDLERLIADAIHDNPAFQPPAAGIEVRSPLLKVRGHEASLMQAIVNLLSNAVKFTLPGTRPEVRIWTEAVEGQVRLWFEDNGIGIAAPDLKRIFYLFEQIHPQGKFEGTGVGLAIVRKSVERMGGALGVESEVGKGSRFWIQLQQG